MSAIFRTRRYRHFRKLRRLDFAYCLSISCIILYVIFTYVEHNVESICWLFTPQLEGRIEPNLSFTSYEEMSSKFKWLHIGGHYSPYCIPAQNVAILIPFRNREAHLRVLLNNLHPILYRQQLMYTVYVIEQVDEKPFNKGKLYNIGYQETLKRNHTCFIFHDVDLIPENDKILYGCSRSPMHLSREIDKFGYRLCDYNLIGGVSAWRKREFEMVNGWSNAFFNWGGEDDDLSYRIMANGLSIHRYRESLARYTMLKHKRTTINTARFHLLEDSHKRFPIDGLSSLVYIPPTVELHQLFTKISVRV
ncbi:beta-1,4-N-acetylgalactosaminyltransferase bre-4-like [Ostrea edulis]|uniref:beta-1,4-N-acetylgalactosaminyltransferase bre-4-like n=1 Tax=Ostrea edulis TaxID=37623 RepID=UPI0024AF25A2|nr:beta-1,4-N-acetylgalactosaminyltransferase bre-4-like [Ostrea edulis]XP_055996011.1 beta-1,4-N-acetylgalactosaminyltransferase bre-4-like [Ostrea edulis]XP_055996012.1 beta-1,4-N-acetylgalactosaminyltransferase bre-4-like [Ostrea edulis]